MKKDAIADLQYEIDQEAPPVNYEKDLLFLREQSEFDEKEGYKKCTKISPGYKEGCFLEIVSKERQKKRVPHGRKSNYKFEGYPVGEIRRTDGWNNFDISNGKVITEKGSMIIGEKEIRFEAYRLDQGVKPCFVFFHGGGFISGSVKTVRNICKGLACKGDFCVYNIDYSLAPESKYPTALEEGEEVIRYLHKHAASLQIDADKIAVIGDSAGGNIAGALTWRDCIKNHYISYQALLYPVVVLDREMENTLCPWSLEQYHIAEDDLLIKKAMAYIQNSLEDVNRLYIGDCKGMLEDVNLISDRDFSKLPRTFLVTAEYDYLRIQEEYFAKLLTKNQVEIKVVNYKGMDHAFMDKIGYFPQAEDCLEMIVKDFKQFEKDREVMKKRYRGILFDLDGVICFTDRYHYEAWKKIADKLGIAFDEKINDRLRGVSRMESLEIILEGTDREYSSEEKGRLAEEKNEAYRVLLGRMTKKDLSGEVRDTLWELKSRGYKLAVASSSKNAKMILDRIGLGDFFDAVSDGTNIVKSKPDPEVFLKAAQFIKERPEDCLVVEDAAAGIAGACAAGMDSAGIGMAAEDSRAVYALRKFNDLLEILV